MKPKLFFLFFSSNFGDRKVLVLFVCVRMTCLGIFMLVARIVILKQRKKSGFGSLQN